MSIHLRTQISLLYAEATELLNNKKEFPVPPKIGGQTDREYLRIIESILEDLTAEQVEIAEISTQLSDVDDKWTTLRTNMTGNERMQDNTEYDAFITTVPFAQTMSDLRRYLRFLRSQRRRLENLIPKKVDNTLPAASSLIHLPKTELPSFSGDCVSFLSFWNSFKAGVHDLPIVDSIKFTYLKQCLSGPPLTLINALPITDDSYSIAIELLRKNFDNPTEVARSLHNSLRKLPHVRGGDHFCSDLRNLLDQLEGICVQMSQRNQSYDTTSFQMEVEERLPSFVLDEIFKSKEEDHEWSSLKLKEKLHNILKRKEQIETLTINSTSLRSPIPSSFSKSPQISRTPNNIPTLTFNTRMEENIDSPPMQTLYNEAQPRITNFSYQSINGYSPYKSSLKNNPTGQISNLKGQLSPNCNGQTPKGIKKISPRKHKLKPPNKEPLLFNTPLKNPKELFGSNRSSCLPKSQKRNGEQQIRPLFPLDRNRPYGNFSSLNPQNPFKNSNVLNPKPVNIPKTAQKSSSIFAGRERAHRVLPSTYNPMITYPTPVTYKNNLPPTFRNTPPLIPSLFHKIFLPTGVALPSNPSGVFAHGEYAPTLRSYQLTPLDSTILINSYPKQQMYPTYGSIPWCSFMPMERCAFA
uniref:Uncharacterized protein n=2 Tax=Meloidogyne TaxID=189290 RepID=A0A914LA78_MELIC